MHRRYESRNIGTIVNLSYQSINIRGRFGGVRERLSTVYETIALAKQFRQRQRRSIVVKRGYQQWKEQW